MIKKVSTLFILTIIFVSVDISAQKNSQPQCDILSNVQTVDFCYLVNNPQLFADKVIRVRATFYVIIPDSDGLYDRNCEHKVVDPVFDCDSEESCKVLRKALAQNTSFRGDVSRVEIIAVGKLKIIPDRAKPGESRLKFYISRIERTIKIGSDVPFP